MGVRVPSTISGKGCHCVSRDLLSDDVHPYEASGHKNNCILSQRQDPPTMRRYVDSQGWYMEKSGESFFFFFPCLLGMHLLHMEVPRLGVESELQLLTYTTAHSNAGILTH